MPFVKADVNTRIQQLKATDPAFKKAWDESREEYRILGELVKLRKEHGISQVELAEKAGIKQQVISRLEKRENSPTLKTLCSVLDAMGYRIELVQKTLQ